MRIAYICADRGVSVRGDAGSGVHLRELLAALARRGHTVHLLTAGANAAAAADLPFAVIDLNADPFLGELRQRMGREARASGQTTRAAELYSLLLNQTLTQALQRLAGEVDVVCERQSLWSYAGLQFARAHRLPFVLEVNAPLTAQQLDYRALELADAAGAIEQLLCSEADAVLVTAPSLIETVRRRGASRRRVRLLRCGVSQRMFPADARLGPRGGQEFVLGFAGSLKAWHGIEILLYAFAQLRQRSPVYRLLVVGDGPLLPTVRSFCHQHRLEPYVTITGSVPHDDMPRLLAQMDAGLAPYPALPSFYFSPLKLWEYAAAGVPIVASASGDLPALFPHKSAALLHAPGKIHKLVEHVELLRQSPGLGVRLARRARRIARLNTWDRLAARFEAIVGRLR